MKNRKTALDCAKVKDVRAVALTYNGQPAGKIVACYGESSCIATVCIWAGPFSKLPKSTARSHGYGYDRFGACLEEIIPGAPGGGASSVLYWLENEHGYGVLEVL